MGFDFIIMCILIGLLLVAAVFAVCVYDLMPSAFLLAVASALVAVILYMLDMRLAAAIELAVCVGLVTAIYASAISLVRPAPTDKTERSKANLSAAKRAWARRHIPLPIILLVLTALVFIFVPRLDLPINTSEVLSTSSQSILWGARALDIFGLGFLIHAGVLGVAVLIGPREER